MAELGEFTVDTAIVPSMGGGGTGLSRSFGLDKQGSV